MGQRWAEARTWNFGAVTGGCEFHSLAGEGQFILVTQKWQNYAGWDHLSGQVCYYLESVAPFMQTNLHSKGFCVKDALAVMVRASGGGSLELPLFKSPSPRWPVAQPLPL